MLDLCLVYYICFGFFGRTSDSWCCLSLYALTLYISVMLVILQCDTSLVHTCAYINKLEIYKISQNVMPMRDLG